MQFILEPKWDLEVKKLFIYFILDIFYKKFNKKINWMKK